MEDLLDFSKDLDIDLLDRVVGAFYEGKGTQAEVSWMEDGMSVWMRANGRRV